MKSVTVEEALKKCAAKTNDKGHVVLNRFDKKKFNTLMLAIANDPEFKVQVAKKTGGEVVLGDIFPTKEFRKFLKKVVEKAGVDSKESELVLSDSFQIPSVEGMYDFMSAVIYEYLNAGNRFDFPNREGFTGSLMLKEIPETKKQYNSRNPRTNESIGLFESTKKKHKELKVKSSCPTYLSSKRKIK